MNTLGKSITYGIFGFMLLVSLGCSFVHPEAEDHSGAGDVSALAGGKFINFVPKLKTPSQLERFREVMIQSRNILVQSSQGMSKPHAALQGILYRAILEQDGVPREQIHQVLASLVSPDSTLCAGVSCARIFGLQLEDIDTFLDEAYKTALRTSRVKDSERHILAGSLQRKVESQPKTMIFGHRGASSFYPENTLSAVKAAWADVDGAEIDIQLTRDNVPVVLHDDTLRRTAEIWPENHSFAGKYLDVPVGELDWDDIKNVAIGPRGEKIPTLGSIFEELSRHPDKKILVEIKSYDQSDRALQKRMILALDQAVAALPQKNRQQVMLISFDQEVLRASKSAGNLRDLDRYWLLSGTQIEEAHKQDGLQDLLKIAGEFTGLDIESGPYLYKKMTHGKNIVQLIKENGRDVIVWISRRQRTDGAYWLNVSKSLGVNIFTSDLPLDLLFPARKPMRATQAVEILKKGGVPASLLKDRSGVDSQLLIGDKKFAFYAPTWSEFRNSPSEDLAQAIKTDIIYLSDLVDGVVVSLADLTAKEQGVFLNALRSLPAPLKQTVKVVRPDLSSKVHDRSVIDVPSAKSRLREVNAAKGTLIQM